VLTHIRIGCTIQLGIGGMPNALGTLITETDLKDLGGHTEMLGEAYMDMIESGKMNNSKKTLDRGKTVYTFAAGSQRLYDWMDHNSALASFNVEYVNSPLNLASIDDLISNHQALEVDSLQPGQRRKKVQDLNRYPATEGCWTLCSVLSIQREGEHHLSAVDPYR
jgi:acyl-CoA hydrolase